MPRQPSIALRFVRGQVVQDHVDLFVLILLHHTVHEVEELQPSAAFGTITFSIVHTTAMYNAVAGVTYNPLPDADGNAYGVIDHVTATGNAAGITIFSGHSGITAGAISNSVISNNSLLGLSAYGTFTVDSDEINNNNYQNNNIAYGLAVFGTVLLSRTVVTQNGNYGIVVDGILNTFENNQIYGNGNSSNDNISGTFNKITQQ